MTAIELITSHVCPFAQRTHMALIEKGLEFSVREVDLSNKPAWFEEVSPTSKVPVVKIADEIVWESAIANEYIEDKFPDVPLLPDDPWLRPRRASGSITATPGGSRTSTRCWERRTPRVRRTSVTG